MQTNLTIAMVCPSEEHRHMLRRTLESQHATVIEKTAYPTYNNLLALVDVECDAFLIEIDTDPDTALDIVETICSQKPLATVMVYSSTRNPELLVRSMRTGAREFLSGVVSPAIMAEALVRAAARRSEHEAKKTQGKVLVFWGAKGGSGVTTLAANFALALRADTGGEVAIVDLNPQLGDVGVFLGVKPEFTLAEALRNPNRLDEEFLSVMTARHQSGLAVIAAPDEYNATIPLDSRSIRKLVGLVQSQYPYVVIDAGPGLGAVAEQLFQMADKIYLVSQMDIPSLRNTQRFLSFMQTNGNPKVEVVLNRFDPRRSNFDESQVTKALGMAPKWKVPNDYDSVRRAANSGTPVLEEKTAVATVIRQMARAATGRPFDPEKRKSGFKLFG